MGSIVRRIAAALHLLDEGALDALADQRAREREATRRANRRFDRHGPTDRDLRRGGRYRGRRPPRSVVRRARDPDADPYAVLYDQR